ncbi:FprA family A-type flavoprotein [Acetivibrio thermocellus]|uniref:FprA family A-type flavoprotein n=1 Tax=Acetivibrio thermocellus TaxID=1515 RepID=UPI00003C9181|nr:FprA family A-type flavoprotein [Acetivibrio thermocellus]
MSVLIFGIIIEKPTVIDTVDIEFGKEYVDNLSKIIDPENIEYIVINHVEPDHAGALPALAAKAKNAKIVTTKLASELLKDMFKLHNREFAIIKDGDTLDIGGKTLSFFETPYLHTEETMITYVNENKILFPCDIFSTHIANYELFNDLAKGEYIEDFKVYYRLIMAPHRPYVRDMLEKIKKLNIEVIAPSHGYILRENTAKFIQMYDEMSSLAALKQPKKVTIVYSTMTGNTAKIAQKLVQGLESAGVETSVFNLKNSDLAEVRKKITESDGILVGSSTRYADMVGNVEELLKLLEGEEVKNKFAAAFGSYGWSGEAIMHIENYLDKIGFNVINQKYLIGSAGIDIPLFPLRIKFARQEGLELAEEAGRVFGEQVLTH